MNPRRNHELTKKNEDHEMLFPKAIFVRLRNLRAFVVPVSDSGRAVWPKLAFAVAEDDRVAVRVNSRRNHEATKKNEGAFVVPVIDSGRAVWPKL